MTIAAVVLRAALAACFLGHGAVALGVHAPWLSFFALFGIPVEAARALLPLVGVLDVAIAALLLLWPMRALIFWCLCWTLFTALLRPLASGSVYDVVIRATNWGPPLALLALSAGRPSSVRLTSLKPGARQVSAAMLALTASLVAIAVGIAGLGSPLPAGQGLWHWLEKAGLLGVPIALAALVVGRVRAAR